MSTGDKPGAGRAGEVPAAGCATWECFRDEAYYGMSCVRRNGERKFGQGFHVSTLEEAEELTRILNDLERDKRRRGRLDKRLDYFGRISLRVQGKPGRFIAPNGSRWADAESALSFFFEENRINSDALNAVVKELNAIKAHNRGMGFAAMDGGSTPHAKRQEDLP